jgi:hypothetical protein
MSLSGAYNFDVASRFFKINTTSQHSKKLSEFLYSVIIKRNLKFHIYIFLFLLNETTIEAATTNAAL